MFEKSLPHFTRFFQKQSEPLYLCFDKIIIIIIHYYYSCWKKTIWAAHPCIPSTWVPPSPGALYLKWSWRDTSHVEKRWMYYVFSIKIPLIAGRGLNHATKSQQIFNYTFWYCLLLENCRSYSVDNLRKISIFKFWNCLLTLTEPTSLTKSHFLQSQLLAHAPSILGWCHRPGVYTERSILSKVHLTPVAHWKRDRSPCTRGPGFKPRFRGTSCICQICAKTQMFH